MEEQRQAVKEIELTYFFPDICNMYTFQSYKYNWKPELASYSVSLHDPFETIVKSHNQFITSVGLEMSEEDQNLPYLYWTLNLHKLP